MSLKEPDVDLFYHLETSLHRPEVRTSALHVAELLTDEFVEFGKSGRVYDRQVTIDALAGESVSGASIVPQVTDFSVVALSNEVVLVRYRSVRTTVSDARRRFETLRSSIWKLDSGRWQMVFHQGTPVERG